MIEQMIADGLSEDEIVQRMYDALGIAEIDARFMYGIVAGTIVGNAVLVDEDGNETALPSESFLE